MKKRSFYFLIEDAEIRDFWSMTYKSFFSRCFPEISVEIKDLKNGFEMIVESPWVDVREAMKRMFPKPMGEGLVSELFVKIEDSELPDKVKNILCMYDVEYVGKMLAKGDGLLVFRGFGPKRMAEVEKYMKAHGLSWEDGKGWGEAVSPETFSKFLKEAGVF